MPLLVLDIDASGVKRVTDALAASLRTGFQPELKQIQQGMARGADITFRQQGRPTRWDALSPTTVKRRQQRARKTGRAPVAGYGTALRDTDQLRRSVTDTTGSATGSASYVNEKEAVIATTLPQAALQQFGGTIVSESGRSISVPGRPFLQILPDDARQYTDILARGIEKRVVAATRG